MYLNMFKYIAILKMENYRSFALTGLIKMYWWTLFEYHRNEWEAWREEYGVAGERVCVILFMWMCRLSCVLSYIWLVTPTHHLVPVHSKVTNQCWSQVDTRVTHQSWLILKAVGGSPWSDPVPSSEQAMWQLYLTREPTPATTEWHLLYYITD
jgi:hypothetical protein